MRTPILSIITSAFRATVEEQDDTVVWLTHALRGAGAPVDVLLRSSAVHYAVGGQDASGLAFGDWRQTQPPRVADDVAQLVATGARVLVVAEDLAERGLDLAEVTAGIERVDRAALPALLESYAQVWHW